MGADALIFLKLVLEWYSVFNEVEDLYNQIKDALTFDEQEIDADEKLKALKFHTLAVFHLNLDIACYPLNAAAVVFVNPDGTWVED